mmetsp:Transcript_9849/g.24588  ORF Transcript_9849/g.24588 Transcript_9849/m.24588 type:complete len:222 (+) Transcript_9849:451-1116(+)
MARPPPSANTHTSVPLSTNVMKKSSANLVFFSKQIVDAPSAALQQGGCDQSHTQPHAEPPAGSAPALDLDLGRLAVLQQPQPIQLLTVWVGLHRQEVQAHDALLAVLPVLRLVNGILVGAPPAVAPPLVHARLQDEAGARHVSLDGGNLQPIGPRRQGQRASAEHRNTGDEDVLGQRVRANGAQVKRRPKHVALLNLLEHPLQRAQRQLHKRPLLTAQRIW